MKNLKSHLIFNRSQRGGILLLVSLILALISIYHLYDFSSEDILDISSSEIVLLRKELDSLEIAEIEARKPKRYPFNPNFVTDYKAYTLGMSPEEFDRLKHFRSNNNWINSIADFKRVTQVSDSLLADISPYFKFPDWVTNPKPKRNSYKSKSIEKGFVDLAFDQKTDLNNATSEELQKVSGIGVALSSRIIAYRDKIGGFSNDIQLYSVWGLNESVVKRTLHLFAVKTPKEITKMDINSASASDIATIPGISFDLAKEIWEAIRLRERIESFSELEKIDKLSPLKLRLIQLYLSID
ncbi:ComEA family DNA-binding protein [Ulvibacter antarcticus]|uniref:Competence ComEA-like helix-hairpin-helix protein n=1 Tax=Ulvibacter antarcticus TaxID=442714 RepID=A0A3L9YFI5_9FLAO|nr:helix-hairpin-helix domain-containing protein [Ulvibacter antarcticus]RMA56708.1 competence ComEA-like helix-hairpin-helix protein [Ulvibacter antarcticus]